jgi:hypothetical protein
MYLVEKDCVKPNIAKNAASCGINCQCMVQRAVETMYTEV